MPQVAGISECPHWRGAFLGWCRSGISKDDRGGAEAIPSVWIRSGFYNPEVWDRCLPPMAGEKVGGNVPVFLFDMVINYCTDVNKTHSRLSGAPKGSLGLSCSSQMAGALWKPLESVHVARTHGNFVPHLSPLPRRKASYWEILVSLFRKQRLWDNAFTTLLLWKRKSYVYHKLFIFLVFFSFLEK